MTDYSFPEAIGATNKLLSDTLTGVPSGLGEMTAHLALSAGKGVRARVLLNAAMAADGLISGNAVMAAAAIELLHMATLVHDDVIDDAALRRGKETVQQKFGRKNAVICGDYLLCMSLSLLTQMESEEAADKRQDARDIAARFVRALSAICLGEYSQGKNSGNVELSIPAYLWIISGKTAAMFSIAAALGALLGGGDQAESRALGRYGHCLGMVFQIVDDCKDYEFSEAQATKPVGRDAASGVVTLPLILAMAKEPAVRALAREAVGTGAPLPELLEAVRAAGGTEEARNLTRRYAAMARRALKGVGGEKRENLLNILDRTLAAAGTF
ncbi:MAG: polyprenyl synthetase family protein [Firmicutes bacterium]|nr:polyprenyl synthetase family protein [Bacillota bacterium]